MCVHQITLNLALHGSASNQTIYIPHTPIPSLDNANANAAQNARKLHSLSMTEVCELLGVYGLQDIIPFVKAQSLSGMFFIASCPISMMFTYAMLLYRRDVFA